MCINTENLLVKYFLMWHSFHLICKLSNCSSHKIIVYNFLKHLNESAVNPLLYLVHSNLKYFNVVIFQASPKYWINLN